MRTPNAARVLLFLATSALALPTNSQNVAPPQASPQPALVSATEQGVASYQCVVTTKDGRREKTAIEAKSENAAKTAAVQKVGAPAALESVLCARSAGSSVSAADASMQKTEVKTRSPTPPIIEPIRSGSRPGIAFDKDGSCRLSQEATAAHPDALDKCRGLPGSEAACPADYCTTLLR